MDMTVRYARPDELERVNELRREVNQLHAAGRPDIFRPGFCDELRDRVRQLSEGPDTDVIVAVSDGKICGFAAVRYVDRPESPYMCARRYYHIEEFGVDHAFRRMGVGRALIGFCLAEAKNKNFPKLELDVWSFNRDALEFYEAVGFSTYRQYMELDT